MHAGKTHRAALLGALVFCSPAAGAEPAGDTQPVRAIMGEVFEAMRRVMPASLDEERFADPARRAEIQAALDTLALHADQLAAHGASRDRSFAFLSRSLARDVRDIRRRYADGRYREAAFLLHELTEDCVACHSRLPSEADSSLSRRFLEEVEIESLPLPERARLAVATRQFDTALATHEAMLAARAIPPSDLDLEGHLHDYLEIALRVRRDFERPERALARFAEREDAPELLRADVRGWIADLRDPAIRSLDGFEAARDQVAAAERSTPKPRGRELLVRYLAASGALHRYLESRRGNGPTNAAAYYWLGVIESRIGRTYWLSQTETYLEAAILLDPGGPLARPAYALLEELVISGYSGSGGTRVPPDLQLWLEDLARRIDSAQPGRRSRSDG